jgi:hypothetical protein
MIDFQQYQQSGIILPKKLNLTPQEKKALVAFLKTLTDEELKTDVRFSDPFFQ